MSMTSCLPEKKATTDQKQAAKTEASMAEANRQVGMPNIKRFQMRKTLKQIQELCDKENIVCHAYLQSKDSGKPVYLGKCIGYGVPFAAQFTNPERMIRGGSTSGGYWAVTIPQPDPSGLFVPSSSSATWLMMVDPKTNKVHPVYIEPEIIVSPFKFPQG